MSFLVVAFMEKYPCEQARGLNLHLVLKRMLKLFVVLDYLFKNVSLEP